MTQIEVTFDEETLRKVLLGDKGAEVLLEKVMNEIMQAEMTEHLGAGSREQTDDRRGYRNGSYERKLTACGLFNLGGSSRSRWDLPDRSIRAVPAIREGAGHDADTDGDRRSVHAPGQGDHNRVVRAGIQPADGEQSDREARRASARRDCLQVVDLVHTFHVQ